ncbi:MAG: zinc ABC transporter substrate-binding protein [Desulfuromonadales bacterium]|nr:zinc ABC transporter substrate-binding protein [Desulfuromonadales bacterium]
MKLFLSRLSILFIFMAAALPVLAQQPQPLKVVVSIKPLHSLVAGVMAGVAEPQLLIQSGGSPHGYALRPSEARMLADAELIIWVGEQLEGFLIKPLSSLGKTAEKLVLAESLAADLLPMRAGGEWEKDADSEDHHPKHDDNITYNQHLWLDPLLAKKIVTQTELTLSRLDPGHQQTYQQNAALLRQKLDHLHAELQAQLAPVRQIPYIVFHDAYPYFEKAYGLNAVGSITINPERKPSAKQIIEIRKKIGELKARCVFSEPQFEPKLVATVIEGSRARTGILDPLGTGLPAGVESYFLLLHAMADNLVAGLK